MSAFFQYRHLSRLFRLLLASAVELDSSLAQEGSRILNAVLLSHSTKQLLDLDNEMALLLHDWEKFFGSERALSALGEMLEVSFVTGIEFELRLRTPSLALRDLCANVLLQVYH